MDLQAKVVYDTATEGPGNFQIPVEGKDALGPDWIELVACTVGTREYESLLVVSAQPSHIHQALLMIGLIPGSPLTVRPVEGRYQVDPPSGPPVHVSVIIPSENQSKEVPISRWLINRQTRKPPSDSIWLFAGSTFRKIDDRAIYLADLNGSVISLVNFGDDLLTRHTKLTNQTDDGQWTANKAQIPRVGTTVVIRLQAVDPDIRGKGRKMPARDVGVKPGVADGPSGPSRLVTDRLGPENDHRELQIKAE